VIKRVCVFAASSDAARPQFEAVARELGRRISDLDLELVFGAGKVGLMGAVAEGAREGGSHIVGVIPKKLDVPALTYLDCDELVVTETMAERKAVMAQRSDGFVILPGGFGTLEEFFEILVLKQLGYHEKPIVFLNAEGAFDGLMACFAELVDMDLVKEDQCDLFSIAATPEAALKALIEYEPTAVSGKWSERAAG
jgi:cytokinin riboside 5'-monophosphate phosphoribohydrolase